MQNASDQQRISFFPDQPTAEAEFKTGRLDWIPCRSTVLPQLRRVMGSALGVAPLPNGEGHRASPVNRLRVLALGRSSSREGCRRALAFSFYSVNPLTQRSLTLGSQTVLPANRLVTLVHTNDLRIPRVQTLLTELVFGKASPDDATTELIRILQARP